MRKSFACFIVALCLMCGCTRYPEKQVAVIAKTGSYHRSECAKVMMAKTQYLELTPDISRTYKPCPYCKPDKM